MPEPVIIITLPDHSTEQEKGRVNMSYMGANRAVAAREALSAVLEALQADPKIPKDVLSVAENVARAIGALFEAEKSSSDVDGKACVRAAMGCLSQTLALLQDVRSEHRGIDVATKSLAGIMSNLFPLVQPTVIPSADTVAASAAFMPEIPKPGALPAEARHEPIYTGPRETVEANVGANTESNFFVGFSGEVAEGGVFVATYTTLPIGTHVQLLITLPGGYETTVNGKVLFVRDPMDMDSEPGIGVQFQGLSKDARELVLRFIRKRPPLFFDY